VLALEPDNALVADGDLRKLDKPKRKNLRHLGGTNVVFTPEELQSDKALFGAIRSRFYSDTPSREG
jgi:ribosomal protein L14E/L6E/L27E